MTVLRDASMNTNLHLAFKREITRLKKGLDATDLSIAERRAGLASRYKFFSETLRHHHEGEDTYFFPTVRGDATPDEVKVLDDMESEHEALVVVLEELDADFANLTADSDKAAINARFDSLLDVLSAHCEHEETAGVPIVQKYLTEENYKAFMKFNRSAPNGSYVLPWVCDGAGPEITAKTWGVIPGPVRLFLKPSMTRKYDKFTASCGV